MDRILPLRQTVRRAGRCHHQRWWSIKRACRRDQFLDRSSLQPTLHPSVVLWAVLVLVTTSTQTMWCDSVGHAENTRGQVEHHFYFRGSCNRHCKFHIYAILHIRHGLMQNVTNTMACSIVGSRIDTAIFCCMGAATGSDKVINKLQLMRIRLARKVFNVG